MYGHRARIGYTSPPYLTETFPYEFYRLVPGGVTLVLTTLAIRRLTADETARSVEMTLEAAREMGRAGGRHRGVRRRAAEPVARP